MTKSNTTTTTQMGVPRNGDMTDLRTMPELDRETLLYIIDRLDYQFHFLQRLANSEEVHAEYREKYSQLCEGLRQAINSIEEVL